MSDEGRRSKPLSFATAKPKLKATAFKPWKILVVDDDEEVHLVTKLVLRDKIVFGRPLEVLCARSAREAEELLRGHYDIACILLDVVMEENDSGLKFAKRLREELKNTSSRIVLRTGQPGQAPEGKVILEYAINDYKEKTELTDQKLFTAVVTAIRGYRDIVTIEESRKGMELIIAASSGFFGLLSMDLFAQQMLGELIALLNVSSDMRVGKASGFSGSDASGKMRVLAARGSYAGSEGRAIEEVLGGEGLGLVKGALTAGGPLWGDGALAVAIKSREGVRGLIYIDNCLPAGDVEAQLISLFCRNASEAFSSISMHQALEAAFSEREVLVKEVHHRVRNNLQLVAGLVNMALHDEGISPRETLRQTGSRIQSMASVHSFVFSGSKYENVDFSEFLPAHIESIRCDYIELGKDAPVRVEISDFVLPLTLAIPCGLILNELIVSAFEAGSKNAIESPLVVKLWREGGEGHFRCLVSEAAATVSHTLPFDCGEDLSSRLVYQLAEQIKGCLRENYDRGFKVELEFPSPN